MRTPRYYLFLGIVLGLIFTAGFASCSHFVVDVSTPSVEAGDYTLATSACEAVPGGGMDICRVTEGTTIASSWKLIVPAKGQNLLGGEVDVYYRDIHKNYAVGKSNLIEIPWKDFFGATKWSAAHDGEALALVTIRYKTPQDIEEIIYLRGIAKIVVTKPGYSRMPIDSGYAQWKTTCKIQYSTEGRGALSCK